MQIKMDTDAVRAMASRLRQSADILDSKLAAIKSTVNSAGWQSQAREEYMMRLEMLTRSTNQSTTVLRMMAQAADRKAEQWEAISRIFNGPFHYLTGLWNSVLAFFNRIGSGLWNAVSNIHLPILPKFVFPTISGGAIVGGITSIIPEWEWEAPPWWPFGRHANGESSAGSMTSSTNEDQNDKNSSVEQNLSSQNSTQDYSAGDYLTSEINTNPPLPKGISEWKGYCGLYVQNVAPGIKGSIGSAKNYITEYSLTTFSSDADLRMQLQPGDVVVWDAGQKSANSTHGHAAVIIEVHEDHVVFAESSWDGKGNPRVGRIGTADYLNGLFVWSNPNIDDGQITTAHN